jgi:hypothetical protein
MLHQGHPMTAGVIHARLQLVNQLQKVAIVFVFCFVRIVSLRVLSGARKTIARFCPLCLATPST